MDITCVLIFSTTFVCNIPHSKKNWARFNNKCTDKVKVIPQLAEVAQGVPSRLRPRIFLTFGTIRVVGRQPYAPAAFTPGEIPGTHFERLSRRQGTWFRRAEPWKKSPVTPPGIDPETVRQVAQCLNHYATPGPINIFVFMQSTRHSCQNLMKFHFSKKNLMRIRPVATELFHAGWRTDGRTDRHRHEEANSRFSQFFERA